jgi:3-oxoadipate enol-lactonase
MRTDLGDARLPFVRAGAGPPLVFLHAGIADMRMWEPQLATFAQDHTVFAYDLRGYGRSESADVEYAHHTDLARMLDAQDMDCVTLIGASIGGSAAIDFALEQPERVEALVLVGAAVGGYEFSDAASIAAWDPIEAAHEAGDFELATELELRFWVDGPKRRPEQVDTGFRRTVSAMLRPNIERGELEQELELDPPALDRLGEIDIPTLVIVGDEDVPDVQRTAEILAENIYEASSSRIGDSAHLPSLEHDTVFDRIVRIWMTQ